MFWGQQFAPRRSFSLTISRFRFLSLFSPLFFTLSLFPALSLPLFPAVSLSLSFTHTDDFRPLTLYRSFFRALSRARPPPPSLSDGSRRSHPPT